MGSTFAMNKFLRIAYLRKKTGIKLVSAAIPSFADGSQTYAALEQETESKTHREMRTHAIKHFEKLGYQIYPGGIGVEGVFTLADFLAFRDGRVVFVECLTDAKATSQDIERKMQLRRSGELCFVVVGGTGCYWQNESRIIPKIFQQLAEETDVLKYYYGHWENKFEKRIANLTQFPKIAFDVKQSDCIHLGVATKIKEKTADLKFEFNTAPYCYEGGQEFLREIARRLAGQVRDWRKFTTPAKCDMHTPSGRIFKDKNGRLVAQICVRDGTGLLKVRGRYGLKVVEHFLTELRKSDLAVDVDETNLTRVRQILGDMVERKPANRAAKPDPIESNLYEPRQIVWVLNHFYANRPTKVSEFIRYLPEAVVSKLSYWLRRGALCKDLQQVGPPSRRIMERVYAGTDAGLKDVRRDLREVRYGEIPGKGRPYKMVSYVRHGKHLECPPGEMGTPR